MTKETATQVKAMLKENNVKRQATFTSKNGTLHIGFLSYPDSIKENPDTMNCIETAIEKRESVVNLIKTNFPELVTECCLRRYQGFLNEIHLVIK